MGFPPKQPAWDYPLTRCDALRRVLLLCDKSERCTKAPYEPVKESELYEKYAVLEEQLRTEQLQRINFQKETDWLKRMLEAALGLGQKNENLHQRIEILQRQMGALIPGNARHGASAPQGRERVNRPAYSDEESEGDDGDATDGVDDPRRPGGNKNTEGRAARRRRCRARRAAELAALATATELEEEGLCAPLMFFPEQAEVQDTSFSTSQRQQTQDSGSCGGVWVPPSVAAARTRERAEREAQARGAGFGTMPPQNRYGDQPNRCRQAQQGQTSLGGGCGRGRGYGEAPKVVAPPMQAQRMWPANCVARGGNNLIGHGIRGQQSGADGF